MRCLALLAAALLVPAAGAQDEAQSHEMAGQVGSRPALAVLHASRREDGGWQLAGEYVLLPTLVRRFLEGERSPEIGVTTLKEGTTAILFGRAPSGELRGIWRGGVFKGTRFGPGGQEREQFEFSEEFPPMDGYSAAVRCEASEAGYTATLGYTVERGQVRSFAWSSRRERSGHGCSVAVAAQQPMKGGLALAAGRCRITLRDLGEFVKVAAEHCAAACGSQAYLETMLVDRRGNCRLLRPEAR